MKPIEFFKNPQTVAQKQYEALRMFFVENVDAKTVAAKFGYTYRGFTTIVSDFRKKLRKSEANGLFFNELKRGRKKSPDNHQDIIISLRKKYYSVEDIKVALDAKGISLSEKTIYNIIRRQGFSRLPRRQKLVKQQLEKAQLAAEKSVSLSADAESFKSKDAGILCLLPYIKQYGIDHIIEQSNYPETKQISKLSSILSFVALKASNARRYTTDDAWCMDRGLGLFAGLNVLPKAAWFSSYSHRVTRQMNVDLLKALHHKWLKLELLSDTVNMDFTTIPYWGDTEHLENNWSGKRTKSLASMLAVLAQEPDSGIIDYGDTDVKHKDQNAVVLEFLDFYRTDTNSNTDLKYLVFDSKFTNYKNLRKLDENGIKFVTIRRRGKNIIENIEKTPKNQWKKITVHRAGNKKAKLKVLDQTVFLKDYGKQIRQITITGHGKIKPAIILVNDFDLSVEEVVRKYARRWIIEKGISEQIEFFHLNSVSSSMVIKVDFDLTMSILTHNLFRLLALSMDRYKHLTDIKLYEKFLDNSADIDIEKDKIRINLKKKRNLPAILENLNNNPEQKFQWLNNNKLVFSGATYS